MQLKLTETMFLRVKRGTKQRFDEIASQYGAPSDIHRAIIEAFIEGRASFKAPRNHNQLESLYDVD